MKEVVWHENAPQGKMDLVVDLNFRMDTSALYSDIVLPAATWYEKSDLNSTDMHSFIHPLSEAVPPCWESKSDWAIFKDRQEVLRAFRAALPRARCATWWRCPLAHDTPAEIAQPTDEGLDRRRGRGDPRQDDAGAQGRHPRLQGPLQPVHLARSARPGKRYRRPRHAATSARTSTTSSKVATGRSSWDGETYPSIDRTTIDACNAVLRLRHGDQRRAGLPLLQEHGGEGRPAADPPGREVAQRCA